MAMICNTTYIAGNSTRLNDCRNGVNSMTLSMSPLWQNVRKECGQWPFNGYIGSYLSQKCADANKQLIAAAQYVIEITGASYSTLKVNVTFGLVDSVNKGLWANMALRG